MGGENTEYGADQIQILEGLEAVRRSDWLSDVRYNSTSRPGIPQDIRV